MRSSSLNWKVALARWSELSAARKRLAVSVHNRNRVDLVVYACRVALTAVLKTVDCFARNQTASEDRGR